MTEYQKAESDFRLALAAATQAGVSYGRLAGVIIDSWKRDEPDKAQMLGPRFASAEGTAQQTRQMRKFFKLARDSVAIGELTDRQLAEALEHEVYPQTNALDLDSSILSTIINRLRRADLGPAKDDDDDDDEVQVHVRYALGFLMVGNSHVALVRKARPAWQAGRLNGIGGRVESGEEPRAAMAREFREETGLEVPAHGWNLHVVIAGAGWKVFVYRAWVAQLVPLENPDPTEPVAWYDAWELPRDTLFNLRWLIPLCQDMDVLGTVEITDRTRPNGDPPV